MSDKIQEVSENGQVFPELKQKLKGSVIVQFCPYTKQGDIDFEGLRENLNLFLTLLKTARMLLL